MPETSFDYGLEGFLADPQLKGRVGLVTNASGRDRHGVHIAERLTGHPRLQLVRLFSPEHGFWSNAPDAEDVEHTVHPTLGLPIISLFGPRQAPTRQDLEDLDLIVSDIPDIGVCFYSLIRSHPGQVTFLTRAGDTMPFFDRLAGNAWLREGLLAAVDLSELMKRAQEECTAFCQARERFLLYD